jgi:hypothetical protein
MDGDAAAQKGNEHVLRDALFQSVHLGDGAGGGRKIQGMGEVVGQGFRRGLVGQEDDGLFTLVFHKELGRFHVLTRFPFRFEGEPALFALETAVELPVAELAVEKDALAKLHGALVSRIILARSHLAKASLFPGQRRAPRAGAVSDSAGSA